MCREFFERFGDKILVLKRDHGRGQPRHLGDLPAIESTGVNHDIRSHAALWTGDTPFTG